MLQEAHTLYKEGNTHQSLMKYTFLADLGYEVAQSNVAYILDNGNKYIAFFSFKNDMQQL